MESLNKQAIENLKERIERIEKKVDDGFSNLSAKFEILIEGFVRKEDLKEYIEDEKETQKTFVTQVEFKPIKKIVYGAVSIILTAVLGALVYLVVKTH